MSLYAIWVVNICAMFEVDMAYHSSFRMTTIFHWPPASSSIFYVFGVNGVKFQILSF